MASVSDAFLMRAEAATPRHKSRTGRCARMKELLDVLAVDLPAGIAKRLRRLDADHVLVHSITQRTDAAAAGRSVQPRSPEPRTTEYVDFSGPRGCSALIDTGSRARGHRGAFAIGRILPGDIARSARTVPVDAPPTFPSPTLAA